MLYRSRLARPRGQPLQALASPGTLPVHGRPSWCTVRALTEHGARVSRCRLQRSHAEGRKAQGVRSVESADESATGSVILFFLA